MCAFLKSFWYDKIGIYSLFYTISSVLVTILGALNNSWCPFYYDDEKNIIYNQIMDSPTYQGIELAEFVGYMGKRVIEDSYISTRNLINNYVQTKNLKDTDKEILANFLKKSIIETGFTEKYIDNINVFVTYKNFQELEKGLMEIVKQKNNESLKKIEEEEFE